MTSKVADTDKRLQEIWSSGQALYWVVVLCAAGISVLNARALQHVPREQLETSTRLHYLGSAFSVVFKIAFGIVRQRFGQCLECYLLNHSIPRKAHRLACTLQTPNGREVAYYQGARSQHFLH